MKRRYVALAAAVCAASMAFPGGPASAGPAAGSAQTQVRPAENGEPLTGRRPNSGGLGVTGTCATALGTTGGPMRTDEWSKDNASVSGNDLVLKLNYNRGKRLMTGSEIVSADVVGYGDYSLSFTSNTREFDEHSVFGAFTYDWARMPRKAIAKSTSSRLRGGTRKTIRCGPSSRITGTATARRLRLAPT